MKKDKKKNERVTIIDIAKMLGISPATVSNALSGERYVKQETKEKVFKVVKETHYSPNIIARAMTKKKTGIIGIILPNINNQFYTEIVKGLEEILSQNEYMLVLNSSNYSLEEEIRIVQRLSNLFVDAYIFIGGTEDFEPVRKEILRDVPIILINRLAKTSNETMILVDYKKAAKSAVEFLVKVGHKKIGYLGWKYDKFSIAENKYVGFQEAMTENKLTDYVKYSFLSPEPIKNEFNETYGFVKKIFNEIKSSGITALIAQTDNIALGAMNLFQDNKLNIPQDLSIMGIGNISNAAYSNPTLTTINIPKTRMGRMAGTVLLDMISRETAKKQVLYLKTTVIERESTSALS